MLDSMGTVSCDTRRNSRTENRCVHQRRLVHYGRQALVPEEIVTVPASAVVGSIVGVVGFVTN